MRIFYKYAFILLFISISPLQAGTFTVFQQNYVRDNNSPDLVTTPFTVANPGSFYFIRVTNGGLTDTPYELVSSSTFRLNGQQIVGPSDFSQQVQVVERPVSLITSNSLSVELRGQPGGGVTVQIFGEDSDPPTISASSAPPPNAAGWNGSDVTCRLLAAMLLAESNHARHRSSSAPKAQIRRFPEQLSILREIPLRQVWS